MSSVTLTGKSTELSRGESNKLAAQVYGGDGLAFARSLASLVRRGIRFAVCGQNTLASTPSPTRAWAEANQWTIRTLR